MVQCAAIWIILEDHVHPLPSLVISEYPSYQPCYAIIGVNDLKVILMASSFSTECPSAIEDNGFTLWSNQRLRFRYDVSDCYGVVSPCTNQLRRRHDVNDGGR